ncbi:hypothetical protein MTO96_000486 [Rhipicephalus appendiculatus]
MAVNFVQHNRFNIDDGNRTRHVRRPVREKEPPPPKACCGKGSSRSRGNDDEKATDDFHFEKFKKQFRRY